MKVANTACGLHADRDKRRGWGGLWMLAGRGILEQQARSRRILWTQGTEGLSFDRSWAHPPYQEGRQRKRAQVSIASSFGSGKMTSTIC